MSVEVDGVLLTVRPGLVCYLLNKPAGVVTTAADPQASPEGRGPGARKDPRVFPVGRLDAATEGLLLLTNDGDLAQRLAHPSFGVEKEYLAEVRGVPSPGALRRLRQGVELEDGPSGAGKGGRGRSRRAPDRRPRGPEPACEPHVRSRGSPGAPARADPHRPDLRRLAPTGLVARPDGSGGPCARSCGRSARPPTQIGAGGQVARDDSASSMRRHGTSSRRPGPSRGDDRRLGHARAGDRRGSKSCSPPCSIATASTTRI